MTIQLSTESVFGHLRRVLAPAAVASLFLASASANAQAYRFTDLGTGSAYGINNAGQVVGTSQGQATLWNGTTATHLGSGTAYDINSAGRVVGTSQGQAAFWSGTTITYLGSGAAFAINEPGQIVGASEGRATLWNGTVPTYLPMLAGATSSYANDINDAGQVAGASIIGGGTFASRATRWNGTNSIRLRALGGESVANGINNAGDVVGFGYLSNNINSRALLWERRRPIELDDLPGNSSFAQDINNAGQVVGWSLLVDPQIGLRAALWNGTTITDLNDFLDAGTVAEGWYLADAAAINDRGWITGTMRNDLTGEVHAYLLSLVPEPETYAMMLAGLLMVGLLAWHRRTVEAPA